MSMFLDVKNLDKLFSLFLEREHFIDLPLRKDFRAIILQYFDFFKGTPPEYYEIKEHRHYELSVFDTDYFYTLRWSENHLIEIAKKHKKHRGKISVLDNADLLDAELLFKVSAKKPLSLTTEPIIIGDVFCLFPDRPYYILDGNHRFALAVKNKKKTISAIILEPDLHIQAIENKYIKTLYKVHHNCMLTIMLFIKNVQPGKVLDSHLTIGQLKDDPLLNYIQRHI